ncbi:hypothetical protein GCM10023187_12450 [Nibrella viscosa]|uniref:HTH cro/C1-type domain-containing protein n=1 Tax=Nibrella viscosa TaxID=1084524 RepID=A0ABP8K428_9BACT
MSETAKRVGEAIRKARKEKGLTQKEVGRRLGITESTFNGYESGRQNLTIDTLQKIADALGVSLTVILE